MKDPVTKRKAGLSTRTWERLGSYLGTCCIDSEGVWLAVSHCLNGSRPSGPAWQMLTATEPMNSI